MKFRWITLIGWLALPPTMLAQAPHKGDVGGLLTQKPCDGEADKEEAPAAPALPPRAEDPLQGLLKSPPQKNKREARPQLGLPEMEKCQ